MLMNRGCSSYLMGRSFYRPRSRLQRRPKPALPQHGAAFDAGIVRHHAGIVRQADRDTGGIAAADEQVIVVQQRGKNLNGARDALVPSLPANLLQCRVADVVVVAVALVD